MGNALVDAGSGESRGGPASDGIGEFLPGEHQGLTLVPDKLTSKPATAPEYPVSLRVPSTNPDATQGASPDHEPGAMTVSGLGVDRSRDIYNEAEDRLIIFRDRKVPFPTNAPPRVQWTGEVDWHYGKAPVGELLKHAGVRRIPFLEIEIGLEKGYNVYENRIHLQEFEIKMKGREIDSERPIGLPRPTAEYRWLPNPADSTTHTGQRWRFCYLHDCVDNMFD